MLLQMASAEIQNWMDNIISGKIQTPSVPNKTLKRKLFFEMFKEDLFSKQEVQKAIIDGNNLYLDQSLNFAPYIEIVDHIMFACRYGHINSVKWLYKSYDHWFTDDCLLSAGLGDNIIVFEWLLNNAKNIGFDHKYTRLLVSTKSYKALAVLDNHTKKIR